MSLIDKFNIIVHGILFIFSGVFVFIINWLISFGISRFIFCFRNKCWRWSTN